MSELQENEEKETVKIRLWPGQKKLIADTKRLTHIYCGGVGIGKTHLIGRWQARRNYLNRDSKRKMAAVVAPTYQHLKRVHLPRYVEALQERGMIENIHFKVFRTPGNMLIEYIAENLFPYMVLFMSADNYKNFVAYEFDSICWDECGFSSEDMKIFIEQRAGREEGTAVGQVLLTGVVQKANWYYELFHKDSMKVTATHTLPDWVEEYAPGYGGYTTPRHREDETDLVLHSASFENPTLKKEYFTRLWRQLGWNSDYFKAHVIGEAVAITADKVYTEFDETFHVGDYPPDFKGHNPYLHISFDFNVGRMSCLVIQQYEGSHYVVWDNGSLANTTEDACIQFINQFPPDEYGQHTVYVYGDAAGWAKSTQTRWRDGNYSIIRRMLEPHYRVVKVKATRAWIPPEVRVMCTRRLFTEAKTENQGLFIHKGCVKLRTGLKLTEWNKKGGGILKPQNDEVTHMPEALDFYDYVVKPPLDELVNAYGIS